MINLSTAQKSIVQEQIGRPIQILASAGTGKTRVLTERIRYILENTKKDGVIALTFTNKAAEEMQDRLEGVNGIEDRGWIATIHAIAQRILEQYGHVIGLPSELHIYERDQDRKTVFLRSLADMQIDIDAFLNVEDERTRKDRERIIQNYMFQFSIVKRELLTEEEIKHKYPNNEGFWTIFQAYQEALLNSGGMDFDDILVYAHKILIEQPWCGDIYRAKYKHVCVDEAQDLNKAQYEFVKALCTDKIRSVMMVGDPNQMIYGFNGSSHDYLCKEFVKDFEPIKFELKENYRSSKAVIRLANALRPGSQIVSDFALKGISKITKLQDEQNEAIWISDKIETLLDTKIDKEIEGEISLGKMVVIARNKFVFDSLKEELTKRNIPFYLKKGERQVEPSSNFGKVLDLAIRLHLNSKDWIDGKKLCAVLNIDAPNKWDESNLLENLAAKAINSNIALREIQSALLTAIGNIDIEQPNIPKFCEKFKTKLESLAPNISEEEAGELERSLQELKDFRKNWTTFKRKGLGNSLASFRNAMALGQITEDHNPNGLTLSTVHTMKGLEKDIVFLLSMCEGVFPDYRARSNKEIEEERNNAFVAVTRSRRWIYITYPQYRKMPWGDTKRQVSSRFVQEMQR